MQDDPFLSMYVSVSSEVLFAFFDPRRIAPSFRRIRCMPKPNGRTRNFSHAGMWSFDRAVRQYCAEAVLEVGVAVSPNAL
jgi:hypothetical protein